ncbi:methyltransferase domain-containing protein [Candidatus Woesearchaeota archaeon]|nr:methyltransferase domain-containing protein [Candidatus Woesearchaeota archaeon]
MYPILSSNDLRQLEKAISKGEKEAETSLDLGLTKTKVSLCESGFFVDNSLVEIPKIRKTDKSCYVVADGRLQKVQFFVNNSLYKLIPTTYRPILQVSGTSMHKQAFIERIEKDRLKGKILDAGTGLGYTAITASKTAEKIITVEIDETVIEIAKLNPYSKELFSNSNIQMINGDVVDEIKKFNDNEFDFIIFDGGTPRASGDFFSFENHKQAFRALKKKGKLYHYLPKPQVKQGRDFGSEVAKRMEKAGFKLIEYNKEGSYAVLTKF